MHLQVRRLPHPMHVTVSHTQECAPCAQPQVVGFDMVDDESKPERRPTKHSPLPMDWDNKHNCAYSYYA